MNGKNVLADNRIQAVGKQLSILGNPNLGDGIYGKSPIAISCVGKLCGFQSNGGSGNNFILCIGYPATDIYVNLRTFLSA